MNKKPNFFIVGSVKCGTTSMWAYLRQHPKIFLSQMKEPNYFSPDLKLKFDIRINSEKKYFQLFRNVKEEKMIGEASTSYLYSKVAAENIKRFNPDSRIIIMLRNPVDAICSFYHMLVRDGKEHNYDLEDALNKENKSDILNSTDQTCYYKDRMQYSHQIIRYMKIFDKLHIHIILLEDLKKNPIKVIQDTFKFLQVDSSFIPVLKIHNPARAIRNLFIRRILTSYPWLYKKSFYTTHWRIRHFIGDLMANNIGGKNKLEAIIREETKNRLIIEFKPEVEKLSELLDRDLSHWSNLES